MLILIRLLKRRMVIKMVWRDFKKLFAEAPVSLSQRFRNHERLVSDLSNARATGKYHTTFFYKHLTIKFRQALAGRTTNPFMQKSKAD
jgi:hypothetical protein